MKVSTAEEMRRIDRRVQEEYGLPELVLMENAGSHVAEAVEALAGGRAEGKRVCLIAGSGNNGGDAFSAARYLVNRGARVQVFLAGEKGHLKESPAVMFQALEHMAAEIHPLEGDRDWDRLRLSLRFADVIVDGILGTGFSGELRKKTLRLIEMINEAKKPVLAIDVPSGVETDTGVVGTAAVKAAATLSLGLLKPAHFFGSGAGLAGDVSVHDIGIPQELLAAKEIHQSLIDEALAKTILPVRPRTVHKGSCGRLLVVAGSRGMTGAAALASTAALRAGAGVVTLASGESLQDVFAMKLTEVMTQPIQENEDGHLGGAAALDQLTHLAAGHDMVLIGPGLGRAHETMELVRCLGTAIKKPVILDADALYAFRGQAELLKEFHQMPILTPHLGEMAGLLGTTAEVVRQDRIASARAAAKDYQSIFVLKSECTLVAYPDGDVFLTTKGNAGMATAGSGDVLAGTIAGLVGQMQGALAPLLGVYLHGSAGDLAYAAKDCGLIASDLVDKLPEARALLANEYEMPV